jgi:HEAT repeat protein
MRRSHAFQFAACCFFAAAVFAATDARSDGPPPRQVTPSGPGFAGVYGQMPSSQAEFISTPNAIKSAAVSGAPTLIWETLEHGEKVECLDCISVVAPLLYDSNAKNREIAAWWLRRRVFGVFGSGEVYEQTLQALQSGPDPVKRAYAAYALGEFLFAPGIAACATALASDGDARVRAAAASALGRLNDDGAGALATALGDADPSVKLAALGSAARINSFSGVSSVAALAVDASGDVRRRSIEVLEALHATDSVAAVAAVAQNDADPRVRAAACHALGTFGDSSVVPVLTKLSTTDPNGFVRDLAQIALRGL